MTPDLTPDRIEYWKKRIDAMTQHDCAELQRFAEPGHSIFAHEVLYDYFRAHFDQVGGMTPEISKAVGWKR